MANASSVKKDSNSLSESPVLCASAAVWLALLCVCAVLRPLQLDEILQALGTTLPAAPDLRAVFHWLGVNTGAVPVSYLLQWELVRAAGFSAFTVRLPSIAAILLAILAMVRIGVRLGVRTPAVLAVMTALIPMLFRYGIEARPYALAFALSTFATLLLIDMSRWRSLPPPLAYLLLLAVAPLVQATAVFVAIAHGLFVLADPLMRSHKRRQRLLLAGIAASLIPALIWYAAMRHAWARDIVVNHVTFALSLRTGFGFFKDLTGGGVICTALLFTGAAYGYMQSVISRRLQNLLGTIFLVTIGGALGGDIYAGYFSAPRQAIYCLIALLPLAALGWQRLQSSHRSTALGLLATFAAVSIAKDVSLLRSKENWPAASRLLSEATREGFCLQPVSGETSPLPLYSFFEPALSEHRCAGNENKIGLVYNVFTPPPDRDKDAAALTGNGFVYTGTGSAGGSAIERYIKPVTSSRSETH
jgi:hypothetical protein